MDSIKFDKLHVKMVAHRGLSGIELENTLPAFVAAANRSYFGIETDVYKVADGKYVLSHDNTSARISETNVSIPDSTYEDLKKINLLDKHDRKPRTDLHYCLLDEYVRVMKRYGKIGVLELKMNFSKEEVIEIIDIIKQEDYLDGIIFISFHFEPLAHIRSLLPEHPIQYLAWEINENIINKIVTHKMDLDVNLRAVTEENVKLLHEKGVKINVWTVDDPDTAHKLAKWNVDYITSNILE